MKLVCVSAGFFASAHDIGFTHWHRESGPMPEFEFGIRFGPEFSGPPPEGCSAMRIRKFESVRRIHPNSKLIF